MTSKFAKLICLGILSLFFIWGCGKTPDSSDTEPAGEQSKDAVSQREEEKKILPEGYVLSPVFKDAGEETEMSHIHLIGDSLYYQNRYYNRKQEIFVRDMYIQDKDGAPRLVNLPVENDRQLDAVAVGEDGSLYLFYVKEGTDGKTQPYVLEKRNEDLQIIYSVDITADMEKVSEERKSTVHIYDMEVDSNGWLYGLGLDGMVLCWDEDGNFQNRFDLPVNMRDSWNTCYGLVNAGSAGVFAYWGGRDQIAIKSIHLYDLNSWREMDDEQRSAAFPLRADFSSAPESAGVDTNQLLLFSGYGDGIYMADQNRLWQIDLADGSLQSLFLWQDVGLKADYLREVWRQENGGFLLYVFDTLEQQNYWVTLEPVPADELPEKKQLVLGIAGGNGTTPSLMSKVDQVVMSYNRTHPLTHVTVVEYDESSIQNLQLELLSGKGPDILMERESFFDMDTLMNKGAVEDLASYLADGKEISDEDILPGILDLITKDGRIPRIPLSFSAGIMMFPKERPQETMTPQETLEFMTADENVYADIFVWPESFLIQILSGAEMDHYVDADHKTCSFDSEEFVSLLEELNKLSEMEMVSKKQERFELLRSGNLRVMVDELSCMEDYLCIRESFLDTWEISGFPNSAGQLRYPAKLYDWLGINSASEYKEEAWNFIEFCLSYASRSDDATDRFVVTTDKFRQQTRHDNLDLIFVRMNLFLEDLGGTMEFDATDQEESDFLWEISEHLYLYENENLLRIISEEASAFFKGDISADEAAKRIQNRASLIIAE